MYSESRKKILLLLPRDSTYRYKGIFKKTLSYAPLTLTSLAALVPKELNYSIDIIDEGVQKFDPGVVDYDIVGITCVASSAPRAYELATLYKSRGSFVFLGGAHPSLNPEEALNFADVVIAGYAENIWPELLLKIERGEKVGGIYSSEKCKILSTPEPDRSKLPPGKYLNVTTVIASRGCKHKCSFCSIHRIWNGSPCYRPVDEVIEEIKGIPNKNILLLDPNIITDKAYAAELLEKMIPLKKKWGGLSTISLAKDPLLFDLAKRSGCVGILIGFESVEQASLQECNKANYDVSTYKKYIHKFHESGIGILGCFVLGFDHDDESVFEKTVKFIDEVKIDLPRFAVLTPFPGTRLYDTYKTDGRILTDDLNLYDTEHVIFQPNKMSPERLQSGLYETWKQSFTLKRVLKRTYNMPWGKSLGFALNMGFRHYAHQIAKRNPI